MKLPDKMGWSALRSARTRPARLAIAATKTNKKGAEVQPKFCPKEGTQSNRLKKTNIKTAPDISKFCGGFFTDI